MIYCMYCKVYLDVRVLYVSHLLYVLYILSIGLKSSNVDALSGSNNNKRGQKQPWPRYKSS